jgi:hypothetical protein
MNGLKSAMAFSEFPYLDEKQRSTINRLFHFHSKAAQGGIFKSKHLKNPVKSGIFRRFSEAKSHHVGEIGAEIFTPALIPKRLQIICKVLRGIYTPGGYMGGGVSFQ